MNLKQIPILVLTRNRYEYSVKAIGNLIGQQFKNIVVFDNASTDKRLLSWLNQMEHAGIISLIKNNENQGLAKPMNQFIEVMHHYEILAKVDNDTIVPENWMKELLEVMDKFGLDVVQPKHKIYNTDWNKFVSGMSFDLYKYGHRVYYHDYVGGSGILFKRSYVKRLFDENLPVMNTWTHYLQTHKGKKAFYDGIEIKLLDMDEDSLYKNDYPEYRKEINRLRGWI